MVRFTTHMHPSPSITKWFLFTVEKGNQLEAFVHKQRTNQHLAPAEHFQVAYCSIRVRLQWPKRTSFKYLNQKRSNNSSSSAEECSFWRKEDFSPQFCFFGIIQGRTTPGLVVGSGSERPDLWIFSLSARDFAKIIRENFACAKKKSRAGSFSFAQLLSSKNAPKTRLIVGRVENKLRTITCKGTGGPPNNF